MSDFDLTKPQSRSEKILGTMTGDYSEDLETPLSRVEAYLLKLVDKWKSVSGESGKVVINVVETLPDTGESGIMYFVSHNHGLTDTYDEYIWLSSENKYEKIGNTDIDLTDYVKTEALSKVATSGSYNDLSDLPTITDTTYTFEISDHDVTITGSDGTTFKTTLPDNNTIYDISYDEENRKVTLTGSDNKTSEASLSNLVTTDELHEAIEISLVKETTEDIAYNDIAIAAFTGNLKDILSVNDKIEAKWTDTVANKVYDNPWRVNDLSLKELLEDGTEINGVWLQNHYAHPFGVQFSHQRAFLRCPDGLSAGEYYITFGSDWGSKDAKKDTSWSFTLTKDVEKGGRLAGFYGMPDTTKDTWKVYSYGADGITINETVSVVEGAGTGTSLGTLALNKRTGNLNSMQETAYGWNRWKYSAIRQYLNSALGKGLWWTPQDEWDIAPNELSTKAGYLSGLSSEFIDVLVPVKTITFANTVNDGGEMDITYDKVILPSSEQMYITNPWNSDKSKYEGQPQAYWKELNGTDTMWKWWNGENESLKQYAVENHIAAQNFRLRSADRGSACRTGYVYSSGYVGSYHASYSIRFQPLVFASKNPADVQEASN